MTRFRGLLLATVLATAQQPPPPPDAASLKDRLQEVQARLSQVDQQLASLKKRRRGVLVELQQISLQAEKARAMADGARAKQDQAQSEVQALDARKGQIRVELEGLRDALRKQVRWMQALGPFGHLTFFTAIRGIEPFLVQDRYLAWYRNRERARLAQAQGLQQELSRREDELKAALGRLKQEATEAETLQVALRHQEGRLETFLTDLQKDEGRQKQVQNELNEEALQLERMLTNLLGKAKPSESLETTNPFVSLKGKLPNPVAGSLAQGFGEHLHPKYRTKTFHSGVLVQAALGSPVQAVADGKVIFAEPFQTFGPMVIVDHGGGWFTLYAHLQSMLVAKEQVLKAGEVLGHVGDTMDGPRLSFEIRQGTQAQDPQKWLAQPYRAPKK